MNECSNSKCRRRPVVAEKLSDFWVTKCEECSKLPSISLDKHSMSRMQKVYGKKGKAA
jgi:hypothetical protein